MQKTRVFYKYVVTRIVSVIENGFLGHFRACYVKTTGILSKSKILLCNIVNYNITRVLIK